MDLNKQSSNTKNDSVDVTIETDTKSKGRTIPMRKNSLARLQQSGITGNSLVLFLRYVDAVKQVISE